MLAFGLDDLRAYILTSRTGDALSLHWAGSWNQVPRESQVMLENKAAQKEGRVIIIILKYK